MTFDVEVHRKTVSRALEFLERLVRAAEQRGIQFAEAERAGGKVIAFHASDEHVFFSLIEKMDRRGESPEWRLQFHSEELYNIKARWKWADGKVQRIEELVDGILDSVPFIAAEKRRLRLEQEERERRRKEEERICREQQRQDGLEKSRRHRLFKAIEGWQTSQKLTAFADAVEKEPPPDAAEADWKDWLNWVRDLAFEFDPLTAAVPPWADWTEHVRKSKDPALVHRFWPDYGI